MTFKTRKTITIHNRYIEYGERRRAAMQRDMVAKKIFLFVCICLIVVTGCRTQVEKGVWDLFDTASSQTVLQIPKVHTECPDMLDEGQWLADDDAASHVGIHDKKTSFVRRDMLRLFVIDTFLAGLAALFAYVTSRVYHGSSCPTRGLSRILAFILKADGQKDNISFSF